MPENEGDTVKEMSVRNKVRENPWVLSTVVLALFSVIILVGNSGLPYTGHSISDDELRMFYDKNVVGVPPEVPTLDVYDRLDCYECTKFYVDYLPSLVKDYVRFGELRIVFHDYPNLLSSVSVDQSKSVQCFLDENNYFELRDDVATHEGLLDQAYFETLSEQVGLKNYDSCFNAQETYDQLVQNLFRYDRNGIQEMPTFLFNGVKLDSFSSYQELKAVIDDELKH